MTGTFLCAADTVCIDDLIETTTLDSSKLTAVSENVGYGKWVRIRMDAANLGSGDLAVFIGSYGARFRGWSTRYLTLDTSGNIALDARPTGHNISQTDFDSGNNIYLYMKVDLVDRITFKVSLKTVDRDTGEIVAELNYSDTRLTSGEMTEAPVTFMIDGDNTTQLYIYGK